MFHTPRNAIRLAKTTVTFCLLGALCGCGNTLFDESASVSGDAYWCQSFTLSATAKVSVAMTSDRPVDCLLMRADQFSSFQTAINNPRSMIVHFTYMSDFSGERTTAFSKSASIPAGTWYFVVMNAHQGLSSATGTAKFSIKVSGPLAASAGRSMTGGRPETPEPAVATPNFPRQQPINPNPGNSGIQPQPVTPPPPPPPPPPLKLSFANLDEALNIVGRGQAAERHAALSYLAGQPVVAARRAAVVAVLVPMLNDGQYAREVHPIVLKWAAKEDAPQLRTALKSMLGRGVGQLDSASAREAVALAKLLLSFGDEQATEMLLSLLAAPAAREAAREALAACGSKIEPALLEGVAKTPDAANPRANPVLPDYLGLLAAVGTEKSIEPLQMAAYSKDAAVAQAAADGLTSLAERLKLKPEQYLFNLINHYAIEAPVGFAVDATMTQPNTRRWVRTAPNRAVKSTFTVQVVRVEKNHRLEAPPNAQPIVVGRLSFFPQPLAATPQFTQGSHVAAVDGTYLIDVVAIVDTTDRAAQTNADGALKKIKAK
jgi:hypothetical protein